MQATVDEGDDDCEACHVSVFSSTRGRLPIHISSRTDTLPNKMLNNHLSTHKVKGTMMITLPPALNLNVP